MQTTYKAPMFEITYDTSARTGEKGTMTPRSNQQVTKLYNRKERRAMAANARKEQPNEL